MTTRFPRLLLAILLFPALLVAAAAQDVAPAPGQRLKVGTRVIAPFVTREADGSLGGFSIELWRAVAREMNAGFDFVEKPTLPELLGDVRDVRTDLAIAAISITAEREKNFDFSQPMFDAGLQIMVAADVARGGGLSGLATVLKSPALLEILGVLLVLIVLPAPFIWWIERREPNSVAAGKTPIGGVFNAMYWSASTLGTQATHMPLRPLGKFIAVVWMFVSVVFVSYFTAVVTSSLTVKQLEQGISGPQDLVGKKVATTTGSTGANYLRQANIDALEVPQIELAYAPLRDGRVQAIVYDAPVLLYFATHGGKGKVQMAGQIFRPESYGILFPSGSALRKPVNEALLRTKESGEYRALYRKWFTADEKE